MRNSDKITLGSALQRIAGDPGTNPGSGENFYLKLINISNLIEHL